MENIKDKEKENFMNARTILFIMIFIGFGVNFMMRVNINIAIVHMVKVQTDESSSNLISNQALASVCLKNIDNKSYVNLTFGENPMPNHFTFSIERHILEMLHIPFEKNGFDWDEHRQGLIFSAFFWLHWASQIPGGIMARKYGSKLVFGLSNFLGCILCFIIPIAAFLDYRFLAGIRVLQGLIVVGSE